MVKFILVLLFSSTLTRVASNDGLWTDTNHFNYKAVGLVRIEEKLESAILLVDNKSTDVVIQKDKRTPLEVVVTPPGALSNAEFFWYGEGGGSPVESHYHTRHKYFESTGEWVLYVEVINSISQVRSNNVSVLVVERISGVRGLADHDSVIKGKPRNYTVLVDKGSHITYTWDFEAGWLRKVNTTKPTKEHTFHNSGTYTITITLTSPLREAFVVTSKVFVLDSGICDTPKVLQFWPKDIAAPRQVSVTFFGVKYDNCSLNHNF
ncbi:polycystin-1-like protein 1 [Cherax quadricarinatus]|uniref:polycystin-1-like protein 1 n=1 Tax=Cherax quadricarinatus TaxID=27406 RepID=UPI00387E3040